MFAMITFMPSFLGLIVIFSIIFCKYSNRPKLLISIIILTTIFYYSDMKKKNKIDGSFDEVIINLSKFIIVTGILGYIAVRIVALFHSGFN